MILVVYYYFALFDIRNTNLKCIKQESFNENIPCGSRVMRISLTDHDWADWYSTKPRHRFAYQCLDNFKMYRYAKFDQNIPFDSRVMSIWPWPAGLILGKPLPFCIPVTGQCKNKASMQNLIQIYHAVQELWAFSLTGHNWLKWCSANPLPWKKAVTYYLG